MEWSAWVHWNEQEAAELLKQLQAKKDECQTQQRPDVWHSLLGRADCRIHRVGINRGGGRGTHYPFRISWRAITIGLGDWNTSQRTTHNLFVQLRGRDCLLTGAWPAFEAVGELIELLGGRVLEEKLTRVDYCLDIAGLSVSAFREAIEQRQFVTRFKRLTPEHNLVTGEWQGFSAGKNPLRVILYDKLGEQSGTTDQLYFETLRERRYGGVVPDCAARLEAQLSRSWLTKQGISTPADLKRLGSRAVQKVLTESLRLVDRPIDPDNRNQQRAKLLPLWQSILDAAADVFGKPEGVLAPIPRDRIAPDTLTKQARGCLVTGLLQRSVPFETVDELLNAAHCELQRIMGTPEEEAEYLEECRRRRAEFGP
jgi:hypothetical protein